MASHLYEDQCTQQDPNRPSQLPPNRGKPRLIHDNITIILETKHQVHPKSVKHPPRFQAPFLRGAILRARQDPLLGGVDRVDFIVVTTTNS
jgi:hypothetical protein